jgi:hypothetical protein
MTPSVNRRFWNHNWFRKGGQGGSRTHGTFDSTLDFESSALNHSATCPGDVAHWRKENPRRWLLASARKSQGTVERIWPDPDATAVALLAADLFQRLVHLALGHGFLEVFAFVSDVLADADTDEDLESVALPVHLQRDECAALDRRDAEELPDFLPVEQQPPHGLGFVVEPVGLLVGLDVEVIEPRLVLLDAREGVGEVALACAQRLHLGAAQDDPRLVRLEDLVVAVRLAVGDEVFAHGGLGCAKITSFSLIFKRSRFGW